MRSDYNHCSFCWLERIASISIENTLSILYVHVHGPWWNEYNSNLNKGSQNVLGWKNIRLWNNLKSAVCPVDEDNPSFGSTDTHISHCQCLHNFGCGNWKSFHLHSLAREGILLLDILKSNDFTMMLGHLFICVWSILLILSTKNCLLWWI